MRKACGTALLALAVLAPMRTMGQADLCEAAKQSFLQRNWSEAAEGFSRCEARAPGKTDALLFRGKALVNLKKYDDAFSALQAYARLHPESDDAAYLLAYVEFRKDKPQESLQLFSQAAKLKPPTANDLTIIALDYVLLNDYSDAASYLEQSLRKDPEDVEARYHLGRVRYQQNQFDLAIAAFEEVIQRDPGNVKAHDNLGLSLEGKNHVEAAMAAYKKAIDLDSAAAAHSEQPYLNLGALLAKSNRVDDAIPFLTRAVEIAPADFKVHCELAKAYFDSNRFELARPQAEAAVALKPAESTGHYLLGRIYQHLGQSDAAKEQFRLTSDLMRQKNEKSEGGMAAGANSH